MAPIISRANPIRHMGYPALQLYMFRGINNIFHRIWSICTAATSACRARDHVGALSKGSVWPCFVAWRANCAFQFLNGGRSIAHPPMCHQHSFFLSSETTKDMLQSAHIRSHAVIEFFLATYALVSRRRLRRCVMPVLMFVQAVAEQPATLFEELRGRASASPWR